MMSKSSTRDSYAAKRPLLTITCCRTSEAKQAQQEFTRFVTGSWKFHHDWHVHDTVESLHWKSSLGSKEHLCKISMGQELGVIGFCGFNATCSRRHKSMLSCPWWHWNVHRHQKIAWRRAIESWFYMLVTMNTRGPHWIHVALRIYSKRTNKVPVWFDSIPF